MNIGISSLTSILVLAGCMASASLSASAGEWARFRGPNGQGISTAKNLPSKWTEKDYNWKVRLPGMGHSSPVIWGNRIFVTYADPEANTTTLAALNTENGKQLWKKTYELEAYHLQRDNSYASCNPALDEKAVYIMWHSATESVLSAFTHGGEALWQSKFSPVSSQHGPSSTPIVVDDIIVFALEQRANDNGLKSAWIAVSKKTGKEKWRIERPCGDKVSYSTPCLYPRENKSPLVLFLSKPHGIMAVEPSTGEMVWHMETVLAKRPVASPVIADDLIFASSGSGSGGVRLVAVRPVKVNGAETLKEVYEKAKPKAKTLAPYVPTSLAKDGRLFIFHDRGYISCLESKTGKELWTEKPSGTFYSSPVWADGKLYCTTKAGDVVVLRASDEYELLAINPLGEKSYATAAIAENTIYFRTVSHLISVGGK